MQYQLITEKEAIQRFQLSKYIRGKYGAKGKYLLLEGNVEIAQDLNIQKLCAEANNMALQLYVYLHRL